MSNEDISRLCKFFYELTLEDIHSIEIRLFPFLSPLEGMELLPAVDSIYRNIKAINGEHERLQSMATLYSWFLPRAKRTPWALYSIQRILSVLDAPQIGLTLARKVRSLDNSAIEGVFDAGNAWCLTILTTQGTLSPAKYIPICINIWKGLPFVAIHIPKETCRDATDWPLLASIVGDLEKCFRGLYFSLTAARAAATKSW
ncbi:hypothetical protein MTO96_049408 [Rhipicephalus appendiculatus]